MRNSRLVGFLVLVLLVVAGLIAVMLLKQRRPDGAPEDDVTQSPPAAGLASENSRPMGGGEVPARMAHPVGPDEKASEAARIAQRMQALVDAADPVLRDDDLTGVAASSVVTPEMGLRKMAASTGMPLGEQAAKPRTRDDFRHNAGPAVAPQP